MNRRGFLKGILSACAAPMFIPASRIWLPPERPTILAYNRVTAGSGLWVFHEDGLLFVSGDDPETRIAEITGMNAIRCNRLFIDAWREYRPRRASRSAPEPHALRNPIAPSRGADV